MGKVSVKAEVQKKYSPDQVGVGIEIHASADTREECIASYNKKAKEAVSRLVEAGFRAEDIKDSYYRVTPEYEWKYAKDEDGDYYRHHQDAVGYRCRGDKELEVPLENDATERIWLALADCGEGITFSINHNLQNPDAAEEALLAEAVAAAKRKAGAIAAASGCKLGQVLSVRYGCSRGFDGGFSYDRDSILGHACKKIAKFNPSDIEVECEVTTEWELIEE